MSQEMHGEQGAAEAGADHGDAERTRIHVTLSTSACACNTGPVREESWANAPEYVFARGVERVT
jgi:hypothetical protein